MDTITILSDDKNKPDKIFNTVEEMFEDMDKEFRKTNPIGYWIDHTLFKSKGFLGYAPHHSLSHPWKPIILGIYQIKYAWQRIFRGWDDRVIWSIDYYLSEMIPIWLKVLKENSTCVSMQFYETDDWDAEKNEFKDGADEKAKAKYYETLDKVIDGFEAQKRIEDELLWKNDPEYDELKKKFNDGFDLFKIYYQTFWD